MPLTTPVNWNLPATHSMIQWNENGEARIGRQGSRPPACTLTCERSVPLLLENQTFRCAVFVYRSTSCVTTNFSRIFLSSVSSVRRIVFIDTVMGKEFYAYYPNYPLLNYNQIRDVCIVSYLKNMLLTFSEIRKNSKYIWRNNEYHIPM